MSSLVTEIAIVGGGPAGLFAAISAAKNGSVTHLFESKSCIGKYEHCAGLLSVDGLNRLGLSDLPPELVQNCGIIGSRLFSPSGVNITVQKSSITAWVVDRSKFDQYLSKLAEEKGVVIHTNSKVTSVKRDNNRIKLTLGKKSPINNVTSPLLILAEGRFPHLNQQIGLPSPSYSKVVFTTQYIMSGIKNIDLKYVEVYQTPEFAPGFFAWIIPIGEDEAKVGLGSHSRPTGKYLQHFITKHPIAKHKLSSASIEKQMSGAIPVGSFIRKTYTDNVMVVGDAAGQTKPTTGGGVILGGLAAIKAGEMAAEALKTGNYSARFLSNYEKYWKKEMRSNLTIMKLVRQYLNSLNEKELERLFELLSTQKRKEKISKIGDVDNQKKIVFKLLLDLRFLPFVVKTGVKFLIKTKKKESALKLDN